MGVQGFRLADGRADADGAEHLEELRQPLASFGRAIEWCDTLSRTGCVLCWLLVQSFR